MFVKFFHAIYERVLKARELVREKVEHDVEEMSHQQKLELNIIDAETGLLNQNIFEEIFIKERYEFLLKAIFHASTLS